jgi:hypothetical protein
MTTNDNNSTDAAAADLERAIAAVASLNEKHASASAQLAEAKANLKSIALLAEFEPEYEARRNGPKTRTVNYCSRAERKMNIKR